jgi:hypothetical protein
MVTPITLLHPAGLLPFLDLVKQKLLLLLVAVVVLAMVLLVVAVAVALAVCFIPRLQFPMAAM